MQSAFFVAMVRRLSAASVIVFAGLFAVGARAADARVEREVLALEKKAIDEDFLNVDYAAAITKLQSALAECDGDACRPAVKAGVTRDLGAMQVLAGKGDEGRASFAQALQVDATIELDPAYKTPQLEAVWEEVKKKTASARQEGGGAPAEGPGGGAGSGRATATEAGTAGNEGAGGADETESGARAQPTGDFSHTPAAEQAAHTPLPVFVTYGGTESIAKVILKYRGPAMKGWRVIELAPMSGGWGALLPCKDVVPGVVRYFVQGFAGEGDPVAASGTRDDPFTVPIKRAISGAAPSLPGREPPKPCDSQASGECPPGSPGCSNPHANGPACENDEDCPEGRCVDGQCGGATGARACESNDDCDGGTCADGTCTGSKKGEGDECDSDDACDSGSCEHGQCAAAAHRSVPRLWLGLGLGLDFYSLPGVSDACLLDGYQGGPGRGTAPYTSGNPYGCVDPNTGANFPGTDAAANNGVLQGHGDEVQGGLAHGPLRIMLSADYALGMNVMAGVRGGVELFTDPASGGVVIPAMAPMYLEARLSLLLGKDALMQPLAPLVFAGAGVGEFDAYVPVQLLRSGLPGPQTYDAWITAGPVFAKAGGGVRMAFGSPKRVAMTLGLGLQAAFGGSAGVLLGLAPEAGVAVGF